MEIHSPGALLSSITLDSLRKLTGIHESRNALIARVLKEIGYVREMGEGMRRIFNLFNDADLVAPELHNEASRFTIELHYKSVFSSEDQHWLAAYSPLHLTRDEMLVALRGKRGELIAPKEIYSLLHLVDWDIYRELIEQMYAKGILWNTMTERQKQVRSKGGLSKRDIPRLAIRRPEEIESALLELYQAIGKTAKVAYIDTTWLQDLQNHLPKNNIYRGSTKRLILLLQILDLIDDKQVPLSPMITLWASIQKKLIPESPQTQSPITSSPRIQKAPSDGKSSAPAPIYVGNLPYDVNEQQVFFLFKEFGLVRDVSIPKDMSTGRNRGFAFVRMSSREEAARALKGLEGSSLKGRGLYLNWNR